MTLHQHRHQIACFISTNIYSTADQNHNFIFILIVSVLLSKKFATLAHTWLHPWCQIVTKTVSDRRTQDFSIHTHFVISSVFIVPQQQNAMGSLHNVDFGVFWASWGGFYCCLQQKQVLTFSQMHSEGFRFMSIMSGGPGVELCLPMVGVATSTVRRRPPPFTSIALMPFRWAVCRRILLTISYEGSRTLWMCCGCVVVLFGLLG